MPSFDSILSLVVYVFHTRTFTYPTHAPPPKTTMVKKGEPPADLPCWTLHTFVYNTTVEALQAAKAISLHIRHYGPISVCMTVNYKKKLDCCHSLLYGTPCTGFFANAGFPTESAALNHLMHNLHFRWVITFLVRNFWEYVDCQKNVDPTAIFQSWRTSRKATLLDVPEAFSVHVLNKIVAYKAQFCVTCDRCGSKDFRLCRCEHCDECCYFCDCRGPSEGDDGPCDQADAYDISDSQLDCYRD